MSDEKLSLYFRYAFPSEWYFPFDDGICLCHKTDLVWLNDKWMAFMLFNVFVSNDNSNNKWLNHCNENRRVQRISIFEFCQMNADKRPPIFMWHDEHQHWARQSNEKYILLCTRQNRKFYLIGSWHNVWLIQGKCEKHAHNVHYVCTLRWYNRNCCSVENWRWTFDERN